MVNSASTPSCFMSLSQIQPSVHPFNYYLNNLLAYLLLFLTFFLFCFSLCNSYSEKPQICINIIIYLPSLVAEDPWRKITKALRICVPTVSTCPASFLNLQDCLTILLYILVSLLFCPKADVLDFYRSDKALPSH